MYSPLVSVIMNTYNERPEYLREAIDSYLAQRGVIPHLIVSTVQGDRNLHYLRTRAVDLHVCSAEKHPGRCPSGSYYQINDALPKVRGKYFSFASSNDIANPDKLRSEIDTLNLNNKKVCYSAYSYIDESGNALTNVPGMPDIQYFFEYDHEKHLRGNFVSDCALIETSLLRKYTPFDLKRNNYAYWDLWLRIYRGEGNVFCYNANPTWKYRQVFSSMHIERKRDPELKRQGIIDRNNFLSSYR